MGRIGAVVAVAAAASSARCCLRTVYYRQRKVKQVNTAEMS